MSARHIGQPVAISISRRVLQVSEECEQIGMRYLNSTSKCSMETFQDVVRSVPVVADAQSIEANRTLLNPLSAGIAKEVAQFAGKATVVIYCQLKVVKCVAMKCIASAQF